MEGKSRRLNTWWIVIPKRPVAETRDSDLRFQAVLDAVLPTGWVDNKTLFRKRSTGSGLCPGWLSGIRHEQQ